MDRKLIEQAKQADMIELAQRYGAKFVNPNAREACGSCPKCGGIDRFHVKDNKWFCRNCTGVRWEDTIGFMQWIENIDVKEAVMKLTSTSMPRVMSGKIGSPRPAAPKASAFNQARAEAILAASQDRLWSPGGSVARDFLESRGLESGTWLQHGFGYGEWHTYDGNSIPAILIPWFNSQGRLCAIRNRVLQPQGTQRYNGYGSFSGRLYGLHAMDERAQTAVLVEGELNCASVWQVAHLAGVHAFSIGSASSTLSDDAIKHLSAYTTIIVWTDDLSNTLRVASLLPGAVQVVSPVVNGVKQDANEMLQRKTLGSFLTCTRLDAAKDKVSLERLYRDLRGAERIPFGLDDGAAAVFEDVQHRLDLLRH